MHSCSRSACIDPEVERSKVKVTAGRRNDESVHVDAGESKSIF